MRKSLLLTLEFPPQKGGTQNYYFNICKNLPKDKIVVLAPNTDQELISDVDYKIYRKKLLINYAYPHWIPMVWHLKKIVKKEKIELIQVGQVLPCGTAALIINKFLKIPYIVYTHGLDILGPQKYPSASWRKKRLMIEILSRTEKIVSNSEFTKSEVEKLGIQRDKIKVVYPSVEDIQNNIDQKIIDLKKKYNLFNKKILLTVCRLYERKGVDLVIEALQKFNNDLQDVVYIVVGDGPKMEDLKKIANESPQIIFTERVSDSERSALYKMSDVFILTPKKSEFDIEGFGIVYIEAGSYGKPVIASRVGGVVEAAKDGVNGILVEPDNIDEIGGAIVKLFRDKELKEKLGENGRLRAQNEFNIDKQMEGLKEVL